jgi:hypothetical protein
VQSAKPFRRGHHGGPAGLVGHVVMQVDAAGRLRQALARSVIEIRQHELRALARQDACTGGANAGGGPRYDADLAVQLAHGVPPCS